MKFHPATQILTWCVLVAATQLLTLVPLLCGASAVLLYALLVARHKLVQLLRRTRWIMFSLLLVYAYSTPGQSVIESLGVWGPTYEGFGDGALQLTRLLVVLAGLAILLNRLPQQHLIAGLYILFVPLQWLGLSRERLAVRLALTLHYAEAAMLRETLTWQETLRSLFEPCAAPTRQMTLPLYHLAVRDAVLLGSAVLLLVGVML